MKRWAGRIAVLVLAAAAGLTSWLLLANRHPAPAPVAVVKKGLPDYSLTQAVVTRYADSGARRYVLEADEVTHFPASGASVLNKVMLDYYPESGPWWRLRAARGRLTDGGDHAALSGDVRVDQPAAAVPLHLVTSELEVLLAEHRISSEAQVTVRQGARETRGIGLRADLRKGTVSLLKNVTSRYVQ